MAAARLYVVLAALLFSTGGTVIKLSTLSSWEIAGLRSGIAALVLLALMPSWRGFDPRALWVGAAFAATMILFVLANTLTTAANAIFLQTTAPLYVLLLAPLLLREPLRRTDFPAVVLLGVGASLFFVGAQSPLATAPNPAAGNLVGAGAGVAWALTMIGLRWLGRPSRDASARAEPTASVVDDSGGAALVRPDPAGNAVLLGSALAFVLCMPLALPLSLITLTDWALVAYLGAFQIGLAYVFLVRGVRKVRALEVALLVVLEPVLSTLLAWAVHSEVPSRWATAGSVLIVLGLVLNASRARETA